MVIATDFLFELSNLACSKRGGFGRRGRTNINETMNWARLAPALYGSLESLTGVKQIEGGGAQDPGAGGRMPRGLDAYAGCWGYSTWKKYISKHQRSLMKKFKEEEEADSVEREKNLAELIERIQKEAEEEAAQETPAAETTETF